MKLIFQWFCKSSQLILGDALASSYLANQQVQLKSLCPQAQGTILPSRGVPQGGLTAELSTLTSLLSVHPGLAGQGKHSVLRVTGSL